MEPEKVMIVDDEPYILEALRRQLHDQFCVSLINSPVKALEKLKEDGGFAVIVADMNMPQMNGVEFLVKSKAFSPHAVQMMLTGNRDQHVASEAINSAHVFRFLNKPCSSDDLGAALQAAIAQHRLEHAERELLQNTLSGSIKAVVDILHAVDAEAFGEGTRIREEVRQVYQALDEKQSWEDLIASMLVNIGAVIIPPEIQKRLQDADCPEQERLDILAKIANFGADLILQIPRLQGVSRILRYQTKNFDGSGVPSDSLKGDAIPLASRIIRILRDLHSLLDSGSSVETAFRILLGRRGAYDPRILTAAFKVWRGEVNNSSSTESISMPREVGIGELQVGQLLLSDVVTLDNRLLISKGTTLTETMVERVRNYAEFVGVKLPLMVESGKPPATVAS